MSENSAAIVDIHDAIVAHINDGKLRVDVAEKLFDQSYQPMWDEAQKCWYCGCAACTDSRWREV